MNISVKVLLLLFILPVGASAYVRIRNPSTPDEVNQDLNDLWDSFNTTVFRSGNVICISSPTFCVNTITHQVIISSLTISTYPIEFQLAGATVPAITISSAPFNPGWAYVGLGMSTSPQHILESTEFWPGDNSSRWILINSTNGYSIVEVKAANSVLSTKLVNNGGGGTGNWFTGVPTALVGGIISTTQGGSVYYVEDSTLSIGTGVNSPYPLDMYSNNTKMLSLTSSGLKFVTDGTTQTTAYQKYSVFLGTITAGSASTSSSYIYSGLSATATIKSATSWVKVNAYFSADNNTNGGNCTFSLERGSLELSPGGGGFAQIHNFTARYVAPVAMEWIDKSFLTSGSTSYSMVYKSNGTGNCTAGQGGGEVDVITVQEIAQ